MFQPNQDQVDHFHKQGYLLVESLFDPDEVALLLETAKEDRQMAEHSQALDDGAGGKSDISAWCIAGDDLYGMFARCRRVVDTTERLLGQEVFHYHSKMMLKEPYTGGAWAWHQDYGYWYHYGYPFPDMLSCLIAVDRATKENGCLQVLAGSHKMGRVEHKLTGEQAGAAPDRIELAKELFPLVHCELEPGTALFFHSNLFHASAQNKSPNPRWSLICCYTAKTNIPKHDPIHPGYDHPFVKVPDTAIRQTGKCTLASSAAFLGKNVDVYAESADDTSTAAAR